MMWRLVRLGIVAVLIVGISILFYRKGGELIAPVFEGGQPVHGELHPLRLSGPDGKTVDLMVEIADSDAEWQMGLMDRPIVTHGMLFEYSAPEKLKFWMKNTHVPLDILFFQADGKFMSSTSMVPCTADPCVFYESAGPAMYALEMPAGFLRDNDVGAGWRIELRLD